MWISAFVCGFPFDLGYALSVVRAWFHLRGVVGVTEAAPTWLPAMSMYPLLCATVRVWGCFPTPFIRATEIPWCSSAMREDRLPPTWLVASLRTTLRHVCSLPGAKLPQVESTSGSKVAPMAVHRLLYLLRFLSARLSRVVLLVSGVGFGSDSGVLWHTATSIARPAPLSHRGRRMSVPL